MSELIILSNRVTLANQNPKAGGVAVAIHDLLSENAGVWMGWDGKIMTDSCSDSCQHDRFNRSLLSTVSDIKATKSITLITTSLTPHEYQYYYGGYANSVLWPLLHEQPHVTAQYETEYSCYQAVNQLFAQQLCAISQPDDVIWVHDYHFLSVAHYCRAMGMTNRIGFFLHIPFANCQQWRRLTQSRELITHLAHYDVLGLQTQRDKFNCLATLEYFLAAHIKGYTSTPSGVKDSKLMLDLNFRRDHALQVEAYPVGVNVKRIQQQVRTHCASRATDDRSFVTEKSFRQRIVAVDRIEPAKGLLERVQAYAAFLHQYPAYQGKLNLRQIACPSRGELTVYQTLNQQLRETIYQVNREFSSHETIIHSKTSPKNEKTEISTDKLSLRTSAIDYSETALSRAQLMQLFARCDVGWVNSIKDGMNLVAKEYVAAQDPLNPGVLLLSCHAGASEQMQDAIIIEPNKEQSVIAGLHRALTMSLEERKVRHFRLLRGLEKYDLDSWQKEFLTDLHDTI